jgi:hypothetical protein
MIRTYQLEDREQDKDFLSGKDIACRAVLRSGDVSEGISPGDSLIIILSSGKKYKGIIREFRSFSVEQYQAGELVIRKA